MNVLTPNIAANFSSVAYDSLDGEDIVRSLYYRRISSFFSLEPDFISGVSGSVLERLFNHSTKFGCIAKGKGIYEGEYVLALRGTAKNRDAITDLNCGLSTCSNNQPVHVGFNHTFNSFKGQLESYFSQNSQGELKVHVVGHSLCLDLTKKKEGNGVGYFI
ncbi:Lipase (class 3) [Marinomonas spartinae]|uniref:lipase family protein n=1 Tax=Marinomonas spartinae TaxID=1792290 RepID=UPI000808D6C1|nr:hypothetical protein [Marinomonas spartinae]SBS40087.1 Lipase (class 3) [Marinomonas spartinae]